MNPDSPVLAFILGPTGAGKSALALALARRFDGEIVNCDSLQLYRGMDIGTAKTPAEERRDIPHYLLDALEPDQVFSAGDFSREAKVAIAAIRSRGRLPIVAGGTGFYVRALTDGLFEGPPRDAELRAELMRREAARPGFAWRVLRRHDPVSTRRIHANDVQKTVRAVEVCLRSKVPMSAQFGYTEEPLRGFRFVKIGLAPDRGLLCERINRRCEAMLRQGLLDEVRKLVDAGFDGTAKAMESIGYQQMLQVLAGRLSEAQALELMQAATRQYAKRQMTWFRRDPEIHWLHGFGEEANIIEKMCEFFALDAPAQNVRKSPRDS